MAFAAAAASSGVAAGKCRGTATPEPAKAARWRRLSRQRSTAPGSAPGSPSRVATLAVTATKYSELVTSPAKAEPAALSRATSATEAASVVSAPTTSTSSSAAQG